MAKKEYGVKLVGLEDVHDVDCVIVAVAHNEFKGLGLNKIKNLYCDGADNEKVLIDVKGIYKVKDIEMTGIRCWRL